jgi:hypothetical protein
MRVKCAPIVESTSNGRSRKPRVEKSVGSGGGGFPAHRRLEPGVPAAEHVLQTSVPHGQANLDWQVDAGEPGKAQGKEPGDPGSGKPGDR